MPSLRRLKHEDRIALLALLAGLPALALALWLLGISAWTDSWPAGWRWVTGGLVAAFWLVIALVARHQVRFPLKTLSGLLSAIREGDFSIQARRHESGDVLDEVTDELNAIIENLREQRLGRIEAAALLRVVMAEIDVAVFTFDEQQKLRLVNRAGERLLAQPAERLLNRDADELALGDCLDGEPTRTLQAAFPGGLGRWGLRRSTFRAHGHPHQLVVLTDLSRALREEERQAWQRLLRVLGHELNNSLAPIKSIAASMEDLLAVQPLPDDWQDDMRRGLGVISTRVAALNRFMESYTRLARLPSPKPAALEIGRWLQRVVLLETRLAVTVEPGPPLTVSADADQLEQVLINLLKNAVDAVLEIGSGGVRVTWQRAGSQAEVRVLDDGPGIANQANLFVPFFTTKPKGSGIGLLLSRQIIEAHGGTLTLENRRDGRGCEARLRLPLAGSAEGEAR